MNRENGLIYYEKWEAKPDDEALVLVWFKGDPDPWLCRYCAETDVSGECFVTAENYTRIPVGAEQWVIDAWCTIPSRDWGEM